MEEKSQASHDIEKENKPRDASHEITSPTPHVTTPSPKDREENADWICQEEDLFQIAHEAQVAHDLMMKEARQGESPDTDDGQPTIAQEQVQVTNSEMHNEERGFDLELQRAIQESGLTEEQFQEESRHFQEFMRQRR